MLLLEAAQIFSAVKTLTELWVTAAPQEPPPQRGGVRERKASVSEPGLRIPHHSKAEVAPRTLAEAAFPPGHAVNPYGVNNKALLLHPKRLKAAPGQRLAQQDRPCGHCRDLTAASKAEPKLQECSTD